MLRLYKRQAWLLDDGVLLEGYTAKRKFVPNSFGCGFSYQGFNKKDIGKVVFYDKKAAFDKIGGKIDFTLGGTIETAVKKLLTYKNNNELVYGVFNGTALFSDTVTMDGAYKEIIGKTKAEFDKSQQEMRERIERENKEHAEQVPELAKVWMKKGHEILTEDNWAYWDEIVPIRLRDMYHGMELGASLDIIKVLNNNGTLDEAKAVINSQDHSGTSYGLVCSMVKRFCARGAEFFEYVR